MIAFRGMRVRNTAYIPPNWKYIHSADINELSEIAGDGLKDNFNKGMRI